MADDSRRPVIFGFGSAALDFRIRTADLGPEYRAKLLARETALLGGGAVANALVQVSRLGGDAAFLGKLGGDWIGERIVAGLESEGVDCSATIMDPMECSPFNVAAYAGEKRRRIGGFLLPNSLATVTEQETDRLAAYLRPGDTLLVEVGEIPLYTCLRIATISASNGVRVVLDVDLDPVAQCASTREEFETLARISHLIMPNRDAMATLYPDLSSRELTSRMAEELGRSVVVSAAEEGAFFSDAGGEVVHQPAFEAKVVDTVGAGDAFHGGVLFALSKGATLEKAVELGARCGALNCGEAGAREGLPTAEAIGLNQYEVKRDEL